MGKIYQKTIGIRPKRRHLKDNPYRIYCMVDETEQVRYVVTFTDGLGIRQEVEVSKEVFALFDTFELEDIAYMNERDRHYDNFWQADTLISNTDLEADVAIKMEGDMIWMMVKQLSKTQQRRLKLYYLYGFTYEEIASMEGCSVAAVVKSIKIAKKFLKNFLKQG